MRSRNLLILLVLIFLPAQAQLLTVTGKFRIVSLDYDEQRIGVARLDDDPRIRQNWVYIKHDTNIYQRITLANGKTQEKVLNRDQIWEAMKPYLGKTMKVHGGRDWNGTIDAKDVWF